MSKRFGSVMIFVALMVSVTQTIRGQEYTEKSYCMFAIGYNSSVEDLKKELLANAKRLAVNEIFGELIASFTTVDNFTLTEDVIRSSSAGYIRVRGVPVFKNGDDFGEVCVSIQAYATETDKNYLRPKRVRKKGCSSDRNLTTSEIKEYAREQTIVSALVDYERKLEDVDRKILQKLIHRITYHESAFVPDTETYCVELEGFVYPIEILALTSKGNAPNEISKSTRSFRDAPQLHEGEHIAIKLILEVGNPPAIQLAEVQFYQGDELLQLYIDECSSDSENSRLTNEAIIDGKLETSWTSYNRSDHWFILKATNGKGFHVDRGKIYTGTGKAYDNRPIGYKVFVSKDMTKWELACYGTLARSRPNNWEVFGC